ncbi:LysR family transcriptional regulator [Sphingosinicella soli]|uniref:DNA-binding transcriptional LysR family regulator n=1 Tax=Sphingosinicella soli TaxID=333708 RepID=A0A7W7F7V5_9SPHN|nr:LysR family transcriptional regulator [Sphingosinicella soli]MBB4633022.1 DNA-binding transcriptional LysR family regulator [Sphingosinicella soli]
MQYQDFNLRHLRAHAIVTRAGSISAAARSIGLTQPAITEALARLEARLGLSLFDRIPSGMLPTTAGHLLAARADAALAHIASPRVTMAQFRALLAVAESGGYAGARLATGLAEPTLHRAVHDLSLALKRTLVERRGRSVVLTAAGKRTVRAFRLARTELVAALSELDALHGRESGRIAIGAMPLSRARLLPSAIALFHRAHPGITVAIIEGSHTELIEPLRDGELDLIVGALREPEPGGDVAQTALFDDHPIVVSRADHPLTKAKRPDIEALARYPWTIAAPGTPLRTQWERMFREAGIAVPEVPVECGSVMTIRQILLESDFLTLLSRDQVAVELEAGWLVRLCDTPPGFKRTIGMTTRVGWRATAAQQAFADTLKHCADTF